MLIQEKVVMCKWLAGLVLRFDMKVDVEKSMKLTVEHTFCLTIGSETLLVCDSDRQPVM